jgi:phosphoserine aminotransferase
LAVIPKRFNSRKSIKHLACWNKIWTLEVLYRVLYLIIKQAKVNMIHNFSAGPAILPSSVIKESSEAVLNYEGTNLSILEVSHRGKEFVRHLEEANELIKRILSINDEYEVLFLTGGASTQFFMTAMNILDQSEKAGYIDTGTWSAKAINEAKLYGTIEVLASSKESNYSYIPKNVAVNENLRYVHYTSNNTIFGTQYKGLPTTAVPLVADMSSDIFSKKIDINAHDIIYAGAQKNLGPAGVTIVIVKKDILGRVNRVLPSMLDYRVHIKNESSYNTPPVYPIYVSLLTLRWIEEIGGVEQMNKLNISKANLLYDQIDSNGCFTGTASVEDRSLMNACFLAKDEKHDKIFLDMCTDAGISGIKGHRSVGGFRASTYNAMPQSSVQVLVDVMKEFERVHG